MESQYSRVDKQESDRQKVLNIFEILTTPADPDLLFQSEEGEHMLTKSLFGGGEKTEPRRINDLKWVPSKIDDEIEMRRKVEFEITCIDIETNSERTYRRSATVMFLRSAVKDIRIGYSNGTIVFEPILFKRFGIVCEASKGEYANFSAIRTIVDYCPSIQIPVPLPIFCCWLKGNLEDPSRGIQIVASDDYLLYYESNVCYLKELFRWASGKDLGALDILLSERFMNKESYDIIKKRIFSQMEVSGDHSSSNPHEKIAVSIAREPTSFAKGLGDVQASGYPHGPSLQETRRLVIIGNHDGSVQNYSSWSKLLGYSAKSSVSDFFKKMEGMSLLTIEKASHGTRISLTPYGKQEVLYWQIANKS